MADKKTIGMTSVNKDLIEKIIEKGYFKDQMDAAKFAMSLAIIREQEIDHPEAYDTTWNIGSFDNEQKLKLLMSILEPENDEPYRQIESLANKGLDFIRKHFDENNDIILEELLDIKVQ